MFQALIPWSSIREALKSIEENKAKVSTIPSNDIHKLWKKWGSVTQKNTIILRSCLLLWVITISQIFQRLADIWNSLCVLKDIYSNLLLYLFYYGIFMCSFLNRQCFKMLVNPSSKSDTAKLTRQSKQDQWLLRRTVATQWQCSLLCNRFKAEHEHTSWLHNKDHPSYSISDTAVFMFHIAASLQTPCIHTNILKTTNFDWRFHIKVFRNSTVGDSRGNEMHKPSTTLYLM